MIRPFDLRDIQLVRRLDEHGIALDSRAALVNAHRPLRDALLAYLFAGRGAPTFVLRLRQPEADLEAFGQMRVCTNHPQARLATLASAPAGHEATVWPRMLDVLTAQAGRYGAQTILAQMPGDGPGFEALRRSDFVVYTRQEVWSLNATPPAPDEQRMRAEHPDDAWHVQQLAANTVPRLVQQIELVEQTGDGMVWMEEGTLLAYVCAHRGLHGTWLQLYLHPEVDRDARLILQQAAAHFRPAPATPLYCCVRRYQEWLVRPLVDLGFESVGSQAVMVRHTTARVVRPELASIPVHETGLEATSPIVHGAVFGEIGSSRNRYL